jgi:protease I
MTNELTGLTVAFLVANEGTEQVELTTPWEAVRKAGGTPKLLSLEAGDIQAFNHLDKGDTFAVDEVVTEAKVDEFAALVLPGGVANPDELRIDDDAVSFVRHFVESGKPVAVICHGPWTLVEAGVIRDRTLTSWPSLATDITNAGGNWVDKEVQVCADGPNKLISSRKPDDLEAFCSTLVRVFAEEARGSAAA